MVITFFISHRVLPVFQISSKSKKLFVDGRTYGRKFDTHIIRSTSKVWKFLYNFRPFAAPSKCRPVRPAPPHSFATPLTKTMTHTRLRCGWGLYANVYQSLLRGRGHDTAVDQEEQYVTECLHFNY